MELIRQHLGHLSNYLGNYSTNTEPQAKFHCSGETGVLSYYSSPSASLSVLIYVILLQNVEILYIKWQPSWKRATILTANMLLKEWYMSHFWWLLLSYFTSKCNFTVYSLLYNGGHLEKWLPSWIFTWVTGFIKRAIPKECVCQFWCISDILLQNYCELLYIQWWPSWKMATILKSLGG